MVTDVVGLSVDGVLDGVLDGLEIVSVLVLKDACALSFLDDPLDLESDVIAGLQVLSGITWSRWKMLIGLIHDSSELILLDQSLGLTFTALHSAGTWAI